MSNDFKASTRLSFGFTSVIIASVSMTWETQSKSSLYGIAAMRIADGLVPRRGVAGLAVADDLVQAGGEVGVEDWSFAGFFFVLCGVHPTLRTVREGWGTRMLAGRLAVG
jgi:hypothetical protein